MTQIISSLAVLGTLMFGSLAVLVVDPQDPAKSKDKEPPRYTGQVGEWWVCAPGRVQFQVLGSGRNVNGGKYPDMWFETPADKDVSTLFENLVLDVLHYAAGKGTPITIEIKNSSGDDGSTHEKAYDVIRVGFGGA